MTVAGAITQGQTIERGEIGFRTQGRLGNSWRAKLGFHPIYLTQTLTGEQVAYLSGEQAAYLSGEQVEYLLGEQVACLSWGSERFRVKLKRMMAI